MDNFDKIQKILELVFKLYGEEIFEFLEEEAAKTDTPIDDIVVWKLRDWLL